MNGTMQHVLPRSDSRWSLAVVFSLIAHIVVLGVLNQIPIARVKVVERELIMTVDLVPPEEPPVIEEAPPEETGEFREPPPTNLLDMSAVALPEPGMDLYDELPDPILDPTEEMPLLKSDPLDLPMEDRDLLPSDDKLSALSMDDDFAPSLPTDKIESTSRRNAMIIGTTDKDQLAPSPQGPGAISRKVGYETSNPVERTSGMQRDKLRPSGASRSYASTGKGSLGPPREGRPVSKRSRRRIRTVEPPVPSWVEEKGIETFSKVRIQILESGKIGTVDLTVSSGYRELDNLAIGAVKQWLYDPGLVEYRVVKINFKLK